jgi:hypothetical protein
MATIGGTALTLIDFAKRLDPSTNSVSQTIAELLSQQNDVIDDMLWKEGNLPTGHRLTMRTGLPGVTWRKLNQGIANTKSTTAQVDEATGMLEQKMAVDKDLAMLNGATAAFRLSENVASMEAMAQAFATTLFYGDHTSTPEQFLGLAPRYNTISGATNGQNVLSGGTVTGSDGTSIWLIGWGERSVYGIFPKGSIAGLKHTPIQDGSGDGCIETPDANGLMYRAFVDRYQWKCGLALPDWRFVVRICNIDTSALVAESSAADLIKLMSRALDRLPNTKNIKPVFYMNRTVYSMLKIQALNKSNAALSIEEALGQFTVKFLGVPIRKCDAILNTEAQIS